MIRELIEGEAARPIASVAGYHSGAQAAVPDMMEMEPFQTVDKSSKNYKAGWNACRAAMLHHKERTE